MHARHDLVGQQEIDRLWLLRIKLNSLFAAGRQENMKSAFLQIGPDDLAQTGFVIDEENRPDAGRMPIFISICF
jgi:hypothetical protein